MCVLQVAGDVLYNGHSKDEFVVERTAAFVDQVKQQQHQWHVISSRATQ